MELGTDQVVLGNGANGHQDGRPAGASAATLADAGRSAPPRPPVRGNTSIKPAAIVLGLGVLIVVVFGISSLFSGTALAPPAPSPTKAVAVPGTGLDAVAAAGALRPIEQPGQPPANILDAVVLPAGSQKVSVTDNSADAGQYDEQMTFKVPASEASVFAFYKAVLRSHGWRVFSTGPTESGKGLEVLGQLAGTDGWYWQVGAVVSPTTFANTAKGPGTGAESTAFTIRLFQVSDDDT